MNLDSARNNALGERKFRTSDNPLLTLPDLAELLARTPSGLRATLQSQTDFATSLRSARVRLGRRIYFRRDLIDQLIVESTGI